jgi:chorismate mutase
MVRSIRGAITVEHNDKEEILRATELMLKEIIDKNAVVCEDMVHMIFTVTNDLDTAFPAVAARNMGITNVPLMCMNEIPVKGALQMCIRVMITVNSDKQLSDIRHIYLREAVKLRPDLAE